jgi:hypothetical protein
VRGAAHHGDLLALDRLGHDVAQRYCAAHHEAGGRAIIRIGEVDAQARLGGDRERRDDRVGAVLAERLQQRVEAAQLDRALQLQLLADQPRQLDIEARRIAVRPA